MPLEKIKRTTIKKKKNPINLDLILLQMYGLSKNEHLGHQRIQSYFLWLILIFIPVRYSDRQLRYLIPLIYEQKLEEEAHLYCSLLP